MRWLRMEFTPRVKEDNPDPRIACVLLLDTSGSMEGAPIQHLNEGFAQFCDQIKEDDLARKRAEVAVVTFGGQARLAIPFSEGRDLEPKAFMAGGTTPMGAALDLGLAQLTERKRAYRQAGLEYYRPWLFVLTDGAPTDGSVFADAAGRVRGLEKAKGVSVFPVGVGERADLVTLANLSDKRDPVTLTNLNFAGFFTWLSSSLSAASASQAFGPDDATVAQEEVGEQIPLPPVRGWASA